MKMWMHDETARWTWAKDRPSHRWHEVATMGEDELPANISDEDYSAWFDMSVVDGVRIGPRVCCTGGRVYAEVET